MRRVLRLVVVLVVMMATVLTSYQIGYYRASANVAAPAAAAGPTATATPSDEEKQGFEVFWEAWKLAEGEFYNRDALDAKKMTYGAIKGMLEALGDANTTFANPTHARYSEEEMRGSFDGIGVSVEIKDKRLTVVAPIEDSPGARAGLRPGDVIVSVDGKETLGLTILEAVALIRGPRGTTVRLLVERPGEPESLPFELVRAEIKSETVRGRMLEGDIAYVKIVQFAEPTAKMLQQKLKELMGNRPKAIVLDLRNNPGGLLHSAVEVASQFIGDGVVLYQQSRDAPRETINARRGGIATAIPIVVLINKGSASASEIVAGAIQDRGRGVLVGERSYGKDTVQNVHQLSDRSSVRITIAKWYTPNQQELGGKGLVPEIEVPLTEEDLRAGLDPQLDRALEWARTGR